MHSEGCNLIIQRNVATMIQSAEDIINAMGWEAEGKDSTPQMELFIDLSENESLIRNLVSEHQSIRRDELSALVKLSSGEVASTLLSLELKGVLKSLPGGVYTI